MMKKCVYKSSHLPRAILSSTWILALLLQLENNSAFLVSHKLIRCIDLCPNPFVRERTFVERYQQSSVANSKLFSSIQRFSETDDSTSIPVQGLVQDFERLDSLHSILRNLQFQIPNLLTKPLETQDAARTYTDNHQVVVTVGTATGNSDNDKEIELISSRGELQYVTELLVIATLLSVRARHLSNSFWSSSAQQKNETYTFPKINARIIVKENDWRIIAVNWSADLLPISLQGSSSPQARIEGQSELVLYEEGANATTAAASTTQQNLRIAKHRLKQVKWNGQVQNAAQVAQWLSTMKSAVSSLEQSPFLQPLLSTARNSGALSPLFAFQSLLGEDISTIQPATAINWTAVNVFVQCNRNETANETRALIPVEAFAHVQTPFPGSRKWSQYAVVHNVCLDFVRRVIPALTVSSSSLTSYFLPKVTFKTIDKSTLLQGADNVVNFYSSLSVWRERSFSSWKLTRAALVNWTESMFCVEIDYNTNLEIPGVDPRLVSAFNVTGSDLYTLRWNEGQRRAVIEKIEQQKFSVNGNKNKQDAVLIMRSLAAAASSGRLTNPRTGDAVLLDLLRQTGLSSRREIVAMERDEQAVPLSDEAAATSYRIMAELHRDTAKLFQLQHQGAFLPPAHKYMKEDIQLQGYLGETLLREKSQYLRIFGITLAPVQSALQSGRVVMKKDPVVQVELTASEKIRCLIKLNFQILPFPSLPPGIPNPFADAINGDPTTLPLQLAFLSEYTTCRTTGKIQTHQLLESRVNGQLTPGDVVSRWIKQRTGKSEDRTVEEEDDWWMRTVMDTLSWVRSIRS